MTGKDFDILVEERLGKIKDTLVTKAKEYASESNRLHNFEKAGRTKGISRERALDGMLLKHLVSVDDIIDGIDEDKLPTREKLDEKIGDIINYYILLEACIVERINNQANIM